MRFYALLYVYTKIEKKKSFARADSYCTVAFNIQAEDHRRNASQPIKYEPQLPNADNNNATISLILPENAINNADLGSASKNRSEKIRTVFVLYKDDRLFPSSKIVKNVSNSLCNYKIPKLQIMTSL